MSPLVRRWLIPLAAAVAVLVLVAGAVALSHRGKHAPVGGSVAEPGGSPTGGGTSGYPGGPIGDSNGGTDTLPGAPDPVPEPAQPVDPSSVHIDSYALVRPNVVALDYISGVPECWGTAHAAIIDQRPDAVLVSITRTQPTTPSGIACIDLARLSSLEVTLDQPLGDRVVRDFTSGAEVKPTETPYEYRRSPEG